MTKGLWFGMRFYFLTWLAAWGFLTSLPLPQAWRKEAEPYLPDSPAFFPGIGFLLGFIWVLVAGVFDAFFPPLMAGLLLTGVMAYTTGGLNLDGWGKTVDGLSSRGSKQSILDGMSDNHMGVIGAIALIFCLAVNWIGIAHLPDDKRYSILFLLPVVGRGGMLFHWAMLPPARSRGLSSRFNKRSIYIGGMVTAACLAALVFQWLSWQGLVTMAILCVFVLWGSWLCLKRLGGMTRHTLGACCKGIEMLWLCSFTFGESGL